VAARRPPRRGFFVGVFFRQLNAAVIKLLFYSIITQRWIVYLLRAQIRRDLTARSLGT
jgi:hypothetical protein